MMKNLLIITMFLGIGYSQCDEFPIISIIDGNAQVLIQGSLDMYTDSGASCLDQEDGNISHLVEVSGDIVNMNNVDSYTIYYNCSDSDGNAAQTIYRTVFVIPPTISDENADGYDDVSYEAGANSADPCYGVVCDDDPEMICICGECTYEDEQGDTGGNDCSYGDECFEAGAESGDYNGDGIMNVIDIVAMIEAILSGI